MRKVFLWVLVVLIVVPSSGLAQEILVDAGHDVALLQWAWELNGSPTALTAGSELVIVNSSGDDWTGLGFSLLNMPAGWIADLSQGKIRFHVAPGHTGSLGIFQVQATTLGLGGPVVEDGTGASILISSGPPQKTPEDSLLHVPRVRLNRELEGQGWFFKAPGQRCVFQTSGYEVPQDGFLQYRDLRARTVFESTLVNFCNLVGNTATLKGKCKLNTVPDYDFELNVQDGPDLFELHVTGPEGYIYDVGPIPLNGGYIVLTPP